MIKKLRFETEAQAIEWSKKNNWKRLFGTKKSNKTNIENDAESGCLY